MNNKLIISDIYGYTLGFWLEEGRAVNIYDFSNESVVGNIYCGYVKDVVKNINAAFVEFDSDKKGFYLLKNNVSVKQGEKVIVQVSGDKIKSKDYTLTSNINLNSDCLVLTVGNTDISISKKINDTSQREKLKNILEDYRNDEYGFILRTSSVNFSDEEITLQADELIAQWEDIKRRFEHASPKSILFRKDYLIDKANEFISKNGGEIITDNKNVFEKINKAGLLVIWNDTDKVSLANKYSLDKHLNEALCKKVWLKSGAYLVIEPTEALTVIDVNTGKAETKGNREATFKRINKEAAQEIARQMRLRNLSGIVIVDFINMKAEDDYLELEQIMKTAVIKDELPCMVLGFTKLGLMEISRKKKEKPLHEIIKKKDERKEE